MSERNPTASPERLQAIEESVRRVLGNARSWMMTEEFLANVEAHRRKHDQESLNPKPIDRKPSDLHTLNLKFSVSLTEIKPAKPWHNDFT